MVKKLSFLKATPQYSLTEFKAKIAQGRHYIQQRAATRGAELGYTPGDMLTCLLCLEPSHFQHSHRIPPDDYSADVYLMTYALYDQIDELYIKIRLDADAAVVLSFQCR